MQVEEILERVLVAGAADADAGVRKAVLFCLGDETVLDPFLAHADSLRALSLSLNDEVWALSLSLNDEAWALPLSLNNEVKGHVSVTLSQGAKAHAQRRRGSTERRLAHWLTRCFLG